MNVVVRKPLLSVIVPISNMAGKLNQLSSWVTNSFNKPIQIIIIHDIADEATGMELKELIHKNKLSHVVLIEGEYGNPGYARNAGLEVATGEWCVFWDSDDKPFVSSILLALTEVNLEDEVIIGRFNIRNCLDGSVREGCTNITSYKHIAMNPGIWRMIFRSKIINGFRFTNLRSGEDQVFLSDLNFVNKNHKYMDKVFYEYSIGQESQLTNSLQALKDLPRASELILKNALQNTGDSLVFDLILILRHQLTLLRRGSVNLKLHVVYFLVKFLKKFRFSLLLPMIRALYFVTTNVKGAQIK